MYCQKILARFSDNAKLYFCNPLPQRLLLIGFTVAVFWNGLWGGVPRADQLPYLHQVSQFTSLWNIILNSPSWNRIFHPISLDSLLFRPVLFLQLGIFYYFFAYNSFLWQLASLILHILVILGLHALFLQGRLKYTIYPVILCAFFGCSYLASELVLWNHISGYLSFSALAVYTVFYLVRFLSTGRSKFGYLALVLAVLSEFTYELGFLLNITIVMILFYIWLQTRGKSSRSDACSYKKWILLFLGAATLYPTLSILDLWVRDIHATSIVSNRTFFVTIMITAWYAIRQIGFWIAAWLLPSAYNVAVGSRALFTGFHLSGFLFLANYTVTIGLLFTIIHSHIMRKTIFRRVNRNAWLLLFTSCAFLFGYSFIIAYGRALPRGLDYVFNTNIYYSYIAQLIAVIGISLFFIGHPTNKVAISGNTDKWILSAPNNNFGKSLLPFGLSALILFNAHLTYNLSSSYRFDYSIPRQNIIASVQHWLRGEGTSKHSYFQMDSSCADLDQLPWFGPYFRKGTNWSLPVNMIDVLWPEKSFPLQKNNLAGKSYSLSIIKCTTVQASSQLNEFSPTGLLSARNPGWHASIPVKYPQILYVDFGYSRSIQHVLLLPQDGFAVRAPRSVKIEVSDDSQNWRQVYKGELEWPRTTSQWIMVKLSENTEHRYLRILILSNSGDPNYLTLRGLHFD